LCKNEVSVHGTIDHCQELIICGKEACRYFYVQLYE
jgi:hypothetical protein